MNHKDEFCWGEIDEVVSLPIGRQETPMERLSRLAKEEERKWPRWIRNLFEYGTVQTPKDKKDDH